MRAKAWAPPKVGAGLRPLEEACDMCRCHNQSLVPVSTLPRIWQRFALRLTRSKGKAILKPGLKESIQNSEKKQTRMPLRKWRYSCIALVSSKLSSPCARTASPNTMHHCIDLPAILQTCCHEAKERERENRTEQNRTQRQTGRQTNRHT